MAKNIKELLIVILLLATAACSRPTPPWQDWMFDGPPNMDTKEYHPLYVEGWQDGCESGAATSANFWYKMHLKFRQDPMKAQKKTYYKGWKDAFDYCARYVYIYSRRQPF